MEVDALLNNQKLRNGGGGESLIPLSCLLQRNQMRKQKEKNQKKGKRSLREGGAPERSQETWVENRSTKKSIKSILRGEKKKR